MSRPLTGRQRDVLDFLVERIVEKGYPPTIREVGEHFGLRSTRGVVDHLKALERKGYIERRAGTSRAIEILRNSDGTPFRGFEAGNDGVTVPLVGRIAAGEPILAVENIEGQVAVDRELFASENAFLLRVEGDSMVDAHILDGDFILVRPQRTAEQGEIVVALVEDEATVKRIFFEKDFIRLVPENPAMEPLLVRKDEGAIEIVGKVVGVFRRV
jgi:repressor LexA